MLPLEEARPGGEWALLSVASSSSPRAGGRLAAGSVTASWHEGGCGRKTSLPLRAVCVCHLGPCTRVSSVMGLRV